MKTSTVVLLIATFVFCGCKKDADKKIDSNLVGAWQWQGTHNGSPANTQTPQNTGNTETLVFTSNGAYTKTVNRNVTERGGFSTSISNDRGGQAVYAVQLCEERIDACEKTYYIIQDSTLTFCMDFGPEGVIGSVSKRYVRQ